MFQNSALSTATVGLPQSLPRTNLRALRRLARLVPLPETWQAYLLWTMGMSFVAGLVALQIWLSLQIAQAEQQLAALQEQYIAIEQENAELLWQIAQYTSLDYIQTEASRLGYVPALQREYRQVLPSGDVANPPLAAVETGVVAEAVSVSLPSEPVAAEPVWWQSTADAVATRWQRWVTVVEEWRKKSVDHPPFSLPKSNPRQE